MTYFIERKFLFEISYEQLN